MQYTDNLPESPPSLVPLIWTDGRGNLNCNSVLQERIAIIEMHCAKCPRQVTILTILSDEGLRPYHYAKMSEMARCNHD